MFSSFLPASVNLLKEPASIALAKSIERQPIATPLSQQPIATSYVCQGKGEPILLLHGFDSSILEFRSLLPLLATHNQTWAIDLLGFGFTERLQGISYNPEAIKTHLYYFWKTLINRPVMLVGASMGGATAIDFTLSYPEAVKQLVLINSVGFSGDFPLGKFLFPPLDRLAVEYWRQRKIQTLYLGETFGNLKTGDIEAIRCAILHLEMPNWDEAMMSFTKSGGYSELANKIHRINKPTLILWGEVDNTFDRGDAVKFNKAIARSQLIWLKNCGHVPQLEQPQTTASHILSFF
ncbi:MAG TPA: 2-hydroxy-6-oxohepta-2,4-dienoate hydrolase [Cyanobacteria bacterium UBA11049]|nr:2-hydroxy-6-oxohepta-2,4-dienoate hydrolase [Cyanobacteria bacterium UBA11049]